METERRQCGIKIAEMEVEVKHIKENIDEVKKCLDKINENILRLIPKVAKLEVKAGIWGGISGLIAGILMAVVTYLRK